MLVFIEIHSGSQPIGNIYYWGKFPKIFSNLNFLENLQPQKV